ncbi:hypothetical protein SBD_2533 [Streptomyces bottropensis ATCC 25435]|uniref:Uncharacterized protein n=1 Tax=Streptomyces bottropensis ATCC 25435 TaxID=1054862 RepID=M3FQJ5_9ACTN|nr:hypothetical protein SBD_2533 [Streptomyces bottropensis ATCC 25435]
MPVFFTAPAVVEPTPVGTRIFSSHYRLPGLCPVRLPTSGSHAETRGFRCSTSEYGPAHPTAQRKCVRPAAGHPQTRPHPLERLALGNVYSGVVRASRHGEFTSGGLLRSLCQGCA